MKYKIKESQVKELIQRKKDKKLVEEIIEKVDRANKSLNESIIINEAINDILTIYKKKGLINESIRELLIKSGKVSESQINRIKL
jgi:hypothetical protein